MHAQVGQPNFLAPDYVVDATIEAARMPEYQRYCANAGLLELRQAVAERFTARGAQTSVEQVRARGCTFYLRGLQTPFVVRTTWFLGVAVTSSSG